MSNGNDNRYSISQNAYIKLILHALKHKNSSVNGVLIGRLSGDVVEITDSVPLFHNSQIGLLLPSLEIALIMIEEYYSGQGLSIVGKSAEGMWSIGRCGAGGPTTVNHNQKLSSGTDYQDMRSTKRRTTSSQASTV